MNLPIGALLVGLALAVVPQTRGASARGFDIAGFALSALGLGSLVFGIIEGPHVGWWAPTNDLQILGLTWPATVAIGEFALLFVLPLYLVNALGLQIMRAGVILAAMALGAILAGAAARHLAERLGATGTVILGLALELVGVITLSFVATPSATGWQLAIPLMVYGSGLGMASAQLTGTVLRDVPVGQSGQGAATQSTVRQVGSALGTAVAGTTLAVALSRTLPLKLSQAGFTGQAADQLAQATRVSAGSNMIGMRLADKVPADVIRALEVGFSEATRDAMLVASGFLLLGLGGAVVVHRVARRTAEPHNGTV